MLRFLFFLCAITGAALIITSVILLILSRPSDAFTSALLGFIPSSAAFHIAENL